MRWLSSQLSFCPAGGRGLTRLVVDSRTTGSHDSELAGRMWVGASFVRAGCGLWAVGCGLWPPWQGGDACGPSKTCLSSAGA